MTLVPNEMEQALNRQHDVYAAARDEYRKKIAEQAAEIERLRAVLEPFAFFADILVPQIDITCGKGFYKALQNARAALEEGMTSPDEREDCTGLEDSSTANPCGREDCEEEGL